MIMNVRTFLLRAALLTKSRLDILFFLFLSLFEATKYPYFTSSCVGGCKGPIKSGTHEINQTEFTLQFESRFESGNLQKAVQV